MARPKKPIDPAVVEKLATMGLSAELIAAYLDVGHHTIERRFGPILKKGREKRNARLMVKLFQEAMGEPCNTAIAIFLAKNWLGMTDRPEVVVNVQQNAVLGGISEDRLLQYRRLVTEFATVTCNYCRGGDPPYLRCIKRPFVQHPFETLLAEGRTFIHCQRSGSGG